MSDRGVRIITVGAALAVLWAAGPAPTRAERGSSPPAVLRERARIEHLENDGPNPGDGGISLHESGSVAGLIGPDVIVSRIIGVNSYGHLGTVSAFSVGATACNFGDTPAIWIGNTYQHPVIAQNMYRLKNSRFEQIGQSWLKHAFLSVNTTECGPCTRPPLGGSQLGVGCSDPYDAGLNGSQAILGPRSQVNPYTGLFPYPPQIPNVGCFQCDRLQRRLLVHDEDLSPASNPGATYFVEVQYVAPGELEPEEAQPPLPRPRLNNASYQLIQFVATSLCRHEDTTPFAADEYCARLTTSHTLRKAGIRAWRDSDGTVVETDVAVPDDGLMILAAKATQLADNFWQYEYALQNLNSNRAAGSFRVSLPSGAIVRDIGFHDVDSHSGEPYDLTDWTIQQTGNAILWSTTPFATNPNANALRWGTLYNFRFQINRGPDNVTTLIGLFNPGFPTEVAARTKGPALGIVDCNVNGIDDSCDLADPLNCSGTPGCSAPCGGSDDCNTNGIPDDVCEPDCNNNDVADACDIGTLFSLDCNTNNVPDECDLPDCDGDQIPDVCDDHEDTDQDGVDDCADDCPLSTPAGACICEGEGCCYFDFDPDNCFPGFTREACLASDGTPECLEPCRDGCLVGDRDLDGDVDLWDLSLMWECYSGPDDQPGYVQPSADCRRLFDLDSDFDIDFRDWRRLEDSLNGP